MTATAFSGISRFCPSVTQSGEDATAYGPAALVEASTRVRETAYVVQSGATGQIGVAFGGTFDPGGPDTVLGVLPPLYPEWLGDRSFNEVHGTRFPYVTGAMANGIATTDIVIAMARAGFLGFFGAAGLMPERIEKAAQELVSTVGAEGLPFGMNLIHAPHEPQIEDATVDLYLQYGVTRVSAAAYMDLTPMVVRYAATGLQELGDGTIARRNYVFAKVSRPEVAARFLRPAPKAMLDALVAEGRLTADEARIALKVPVAEDITVESDSGGHTDNQVLGAIFPTVLQTARAIEAEQGYSRPIRVGAAGGLGTPASVASAYALGAAYVLTGSVNQGCVESGLSARGKAQLAVAQIDDVVMAPAADMFEMGVKVQVLKRGTMFGRRAQKLYDLYRAYPSLDALPANEKARLEKEIFKDSLENVWRATFKFFQMRDPRENAKAEADPKHQMALVFRWYLGQSSKWAIVDQEDRALDFQIWCGPAMGAFNTWAQGSFMESPQNRTVVQVARNFVEGAACITRAGQLRSYGVPMPAAAFEFAPRELA